MEKNEIRPLSSTTHKNQLWIKDLNVKSETEKLLEETTGEKLLTLFLAKIFF